MVHDFVMMIGLFVSLIDEVPLTRSLKRMGCRRKLNRHLVAV
jgi:hypothetical protein